MTQTGKQRGFNDVFKNNSPTSQFWNSRGPQMPFLLVILSISISVLIIIRTSPAFISLLHSGQNDTNMYLQTISLIISTQEFSLLVFLLSWQPGSFRFTLMNLVMRAESLTALQPGGKSMVRAFLSDFTLPTPLSLDGSVLSITPLSHTAGAHPGWALKAGNRFLLSEGQGCVYPNVLKPSVLIVSLQFG